MTDTNLCDGDGLHFFVSLILIQALTRNSLPEETDDSVLIGYAQLTNLAPVTQSNPVTRGFSFVFVFVYLHCHCHPLLKKAHELIAASNKATSLSSWL